MVWTWCCPARPPTGCRTASFHSVNSARPVSAAAVRRCARTRWRDGARREIMARFLLAYSQSKRAPELRTMSAERSGAGSTSVGRARPGAGRSLRSRRAENTRRVVVVEDDPPTANLLTDVLADAGFTVTVLDSALGAHEAIHRLRPCAVLLDLGLPYVRGPRCCGNSRPT